MVRSGLSRNRALAYRWRPMTLAATSPARRSRLIWIAVWALLAAGLVYAASMLSWAEVLAAARRSDPFWLFVGLLVVLPNTPLWTLCLACLIGRKAPVPLLGLTRVLAVVASAIQAFSVVGGGATAFVLLTERLGLSRPRTASLLVLEGLTTTIVKTLLVGLALALVPGEVVLKRMGIILVIGVCAALAGLILISRAEGRLYGFAARMGGRARIFIERVGDWASHLEAVRSPARLGGAVAIMLLRRMLEGFSAWCVARACGIVVGPEIILLVVASIAIVTMIPTPAGNVGLYELAVVAAYQWAGVSAEVALAAAFLQHALFLLAVLAPGALVLVFEALGGSRQRARLKRSSTEGEG